MFCAHDAIVPLFLSTPSARRATPTSEPPAQPARYFYPRPPRGGRHGNCSLWQNFLGISIHALREEGDETGQPLYVVSATFLSTPSARRATMMIAAYFFAGRFLSTPSARRATGDGWRSGLFSCHFYPRPPRGGRHHFRKVAARYKLISIHALREEGDAMMGAAYTADRYFYPRPPRGGRPAPAGAKGLMRLFLSTPSARRATADHHPRWSYCNISIHALREEGDDASRRSPVPRRDFYPRPPRGGRPGVKNQTAAWYKFLSTPSARRATGAESAYTTSASNFYPRPPRGGRQQKQRQNLYFQTNYTTFCTNLEEP